MTWFPGKRELYSYATKENLGEHGALSLQFFRRKNRWRALLLLPLLPAELLYLVVLGLVASKPRRYLFLNQLSATLIDATPGNQTIILGSAAELPFALRKQVLWIPVSPLYIVLAWSEWKTYGELPRLVKLMLSWFLRLLTPRLAADGWLIVHSDGLPLARATLAIANQIGARVCCVQHGMFHEEYDIPEIDGSRSDLNVVRSVVDARIIRRANPATTIFVESDLFRPPAPIRQATELSVALIGEAWHTCDTRLDKLYRSRLREFQRALSGRGIRVWFRPHPSERYRAWLYGFPRLDLGSKQRAFERFNVFVGFASTLLSEAQAVGHSAIQVVLEGYAVPVIARDASQTVLQVRSADDLLNFLSHEECLVRRRPSPQSDAKAQAVARVIRAMNDDSYLGASKAI